MSAEKQEAGRVETESSNEFTTAKAGLSDIEELEKLVNLAYRGGKSTVAWKNEDHLVKGPRIVKADLESYLTRVGSTIMLVRSQSGMAVGTVHIEKHGDDAHIGMLSVHPEFQNYGLGKKLLELAAKLAREEYKCKKAKMFVFAGRNELLSWYARLGYEASGETMPFFGPESGLTPLVANPHFVVVVKKLA